MVPAPISLGMFEPLVQWQVQIDVVILLDQIDSTDVMHSIGCRERVGPWLDVGQRHT